MNDYFYNALMDCEYERHELEIKLALMPEYFDFILKIKQVYPDYSSDDILNSYPLDTFSYFMRQLVRWLDNETQIVICELVGFLTFFCEHSLKDSTELVQFFRENPKVAKVLFPHIMSKFETNKNDFLGLNPEHYEFICSQLHLSIKKGNSTVRRITPLS